MQPTLTTPRLTLRPFTLADAKEVQRLAGDARVACTTATIPHPYPDGAAEAWISTHEGLYRARQEIVFAVTARPGGALLGTVGLLDISSAHARAELGYWVGLEHWGQGYCTEAVTHLIEHARQSLGMTRIVARCLARNPASAAVMQKCGLRREGLLSRDMLRHGRFEDMLLYGLVLPGRDGDAVHPSSPA